MQSGKSPGAEQNKPGLQGRKSDSEAAQSDISNEQETGQDQWVLCSRRNLALNQNKLSKMWGIKHPKAWGKNILLFSLNFCDFLWFFSDLLQYVPQRWSCNKVKINICFWTTHQQLKSPTVGLWLNKSLRNLLKKIHDIYYHNLLILPPTQIYSMHYPSVLGLQAKLCNADQPHSSVVCPKHTCL